MEVIRGGAHASIPISDPSRLGDARRRATQLALEAGMDDVDTGRVALVATEMATNLLRHAQGGHLLVGRDAGRDEVELVAFDRGPGIANVAKSRMDGYSTGGTPGTGLGAISRMADEFDIHSSVPEGTVAIARVRAGRQAAKAGSVWARGISVSLPGEPACGDGWSLARDGDRFSLLVADGLGHGRSAAEAAQAAIDVFVESPFAAGTALVERMHARLRSTRGAALALLQSDGPGTGLRLTGAGNVAGRLVSGTTDRSLATQHGTAGMAIRSVTETRVEWPAHAVLVVHTDGLETRWKPEGLYPLLGRDPALAAALLLRDHGRGRDDATVVVLRWRN